jgi:hypothetical protein
MKILQVIPKAVINSKLTVRAESFVTVSGSPMGVRNTPAQVKG